jgi:hypothetical protein
MESTGNQVAESGGRDMKCPKCSGKMHDSGLVGVSSSFEGDNATRSGESSGWSCFSCGKWIPYPITVKEIDITEKCGHSLPEVEDYPDRETQPAAIVRCNKFLLRFKGYIKFELSTARTMKDIYNELSENYKDCPSRSWLTKHYKLSFQKVSR